MSSGRLEHARMTTVGSPTTEPPRMTRPVRDLEGQSTTTPTSSPSEAPKYLHLEWRRRMTPSSMETFKISLPAMPPGLPRLFRQRLERIGPGEPVDRSLLEDVCGSASAANHFLDKAVDRGALVPVAWGAYRVAQAKTLDRISRLENPPLQRFVSWSQELPELSDDPILFVAPWLWRDTDLNVTDPMPLVPLDADEIVVQGAPPQWNAFHMDIEEQREWTLVLGDDEAGTFRTPGPLEVVLLLRASLDPRWKQAAGQLDRAAGVPGTQELGAELNRLDLKEAPRGQATLRTGKGLPARRRLLAPPWYMDKVTQRAPAEGYPTEGSP